MPRVYLAMLIPTRWAPIACLLLLFAAGNSKPAEAPARPAHTTLAGEKVIVRLPGAIDDLAAGGGGRYLILKLKDLRKLAIFDVPRREVVKYLSIDSDNFVFAAGKDDLLVLMPDRKVAQRWSLRTFQPELTVAGLEDGRTTPPAIGYRSDGPVVYQCGQKTVFLDLKTLRPLEIKEQNRSQLAYFGTQYRAGGSSEVFGSWFDGLTPTHILSIVIHGTTAEHHAQFDSAGYVVPNDDGSLLMTGKGLFTPDLRPVDPDKFGGVHCIPAYGTAFFLGVRDAGGQAQVSIYATSERRPLLTLPPLDEVGVPGGGLYDWPRLGLTFEKRIHLFPADNLLVTIPDSRDQLVLHPFNVMDALITAGVDFLFVASSPPRVFHPGRRFAYRVDVRSRRGRVRMKLDSGPMGMALSRGGELTWNVPTGYAGREEVVLITIRDASGQSIFHTFKITTAP